MWHFLKSTDEVWKCCEVNNNIGKKQDGTHQKHPSCRFCLGSLLRAKNNKVKVSSTVDFGFDICFQKSFQNEFVSEKRFDFEGPKV